MDAFNAALDAQKGHRGEQQFAVEDFGVTYDTLLLWRKGKFPKALRRLMRYPALLEARTMVSRLGAHALPAYSVRSTWERSVRCRLILARL